LAKVHTDSTCTAPACAKEWDSVFPARPLIARLGKFLECFGVPIVAAVEVTCPWIFSSSHPCRGALQSILPFNKSDGGDQCATANVYSGHFRHA